MRYVPHLIPEQSKVLPEYFKGNVYMPPKQHAFKEVLLWIIGVCFCLAALFNIMHPFLFLIFGIIGFILLPPGHRFVERKLQFKFILKIKAVTLSTLLLGAMPLISYYTRIDTQIVYKEKTLHEKEVREKVVIERKESQRKDSLAYYIQKSDQLAKDHKMDDAHKQLAYAASFARTETEQAEIDKQKTSLASIKSQELFKSGKYALALSEINDLLQTDPANEALKYNRAICYSKTGKIAEAVSDLRALVQSGYPGAEQAYDKINPTRKRVGYYVTRCRDGTTSNATGRGACSHHGGVKNWNEPVYEEYRKYE